jgi:hypothetical protein
MNSSAENERDDRCGHAAAMGLIGGHNGSVGIPQFRPRAYSSGKFAVSERRSGVSCASRRSKSEIPDYSLLADRRRDWNI